MRWFLALWWRAVVPWWLLLPEPFPPPWGAPVNECLCDPDRGGPCTCEFFREAPDR